MSEAIKKNTHTFTRLVVAIITAKHIRWLEKNNNHKKNSYSCFIIFPRGLEANV